MGFASFIKTRLLNNRVEQYNTNVAIGVRMKDSLELMESIQEMHSLLMTLHQNN